ncbi:aplysianin-A-like [Haliotis rufescens]|uniref:aplysianin-A-like n=1 Tax=Haliotis rufescens TaxID=6454 RepID=UPI00201F0F4C|nr:aplysianin-A-like [Haliotis rufescens]
MATTNTTKADNEPNDCLDIAVIGGGIGGAYTGWRLRDRGLSISVFEYSDRVGGRLFTAELPEAPGTYLEFGGMRFRTDHSILINTAIEIGLKIVPFQKSDGNQKLWYLRGTHLGKDDLRGSKTPFNLKANERKSPEALIRDIFTNNTNITSTKFPEEMYSLTTNDGVPVYKMSQLNFYSHYATMEAYGYLQACMAMGLVNQQQGALRGVKMANSPSSALHAIEGGMGRLPTTLMDIFRQRSKSHHLHLNHQLIRIEKSQTGGYNLRFRRTQTVDGVTTPLTTDDNEVTICARKVILAVPRNCLVHVDFPTFRNNPAIMNSINSVFDDPAGKIFLAYPYKWWKTGNPDTTNTDSDLPCRHTRDWFTGTNNVSIILASYHNGETTRYWRELSQFGTPIPGSLPGANAVTDVVKNRLETYLSLIYNVNQSDIPEAVGGGMMLWDRYPFEAGWHCFKPGFKEDEVAEIMMKPSPSDDVYVVSNSWAEGMLGVWSEGTLHAVDRVLSNYFSK